MDAATHARKAVVRKALRIDAAQYPTTYYLTTATIAIAMPPSVISFRLIGSPAFGCAFNSDTSTNGPPALSSTDPYDGIVMLLVALLAPSPVEGSPSRSSTLPASLVPDCT